MVGWRVRRWVGSFHRSGDPSTLVFCLIMPSSSRALPSCSPTLGVTLEPPAWFTAPAQRWASERQRFERATTRDINGAQHLLVGAGLLGLGALAWSHVLPGLGVLPDGSLIVWSLMVSAVLAMLVGNHLRASAHSRMMGALWQVLSASGTPLVVGPVGVDPAADQALALAAHEGRQRSPRGSFDELVNAMVEARMLGGVVVAPMRWRGGMVFRDMLPHVTAMNRRSSHER